MREKTRARLKKLRTVKNHFRMQNKQSKLVDPASDHILRSKIKPCMSKTKQVVSESAYGSLQESSFTRAPSYNWITVVIQGLIMRQKELRKEFLHLLASNQHLCDDS